MLAELVSALHTKSSRDEDWLRFRPLADLTYHVRLDIVDALTDPALPVSPGEPLRVYVALIGPDGSTPETAARLSYTREVEEEWETENEVEWVAPATVASDYFVMVQADDLLYYTYQQRTVPFSYRVRVTVDR